MEEANEYSIFICDCLYVRSYRTCSCRFNDQHTNQRFRIWTQNIKFDESNVETSPLNLVTFYIQSRRIDGAAAVTEQPPYGRSKSVILMEDQSPPPPPPGLV